MKGFTLVEVLLQLVITSAVVFMLTLIFPWYEKTRELIMGTYDTAFEVFTSELREEFVQMTSVELKDADTLIIKKQKYDEQPTLVEYIIRDKRIVKKYGGTGHGGNNIKLNRFQKAVFRLQKNKVTITILFDDHKERSQTFIVPVSQK